jgi:hypothetical protein
MFHKDAGVGNVGPKEFEIKGELPLWKSFANCSIHRLRMPREN